MYISRMKKMTRLLISVMREEKLNSIFQIFILRYILSCEGGNPEWENSKQCSSVFC